jgi:alcohol oxidase
LAADEVVTLDALWRGESIPQGKHVLAMIPAIYNYPSVESLAQWNSNGKSLIAQKLVQVITAVIRTDWYLSGLDSKIKWRPDHEELKAMDPVFQPRWKEFFQDRPDKAVAIFAAIAGCVHIAWI